MKLHRHLPCTEGLPKILFHINTCKHIKNTTHNSFMHSLLTSSLPQAHHLLHLTTSYNFHEIHPSR